MIRSQLVRGKTDKPQIRIIRRNSSTPQSFAGDEETELMPGDGVEVALKLEFNTAPTPQ
jgi:polysaccharide export outer membrane protein